jgi:mannose-6-phosphate isomerase-like protein (cupin superfamily)
VQVTINMNTISTETGFLVRHQDDVTPTPYPCGSATRIITAKDSSPVGFHVTHIQDSKKHFHKNTTEVYYILDGNGFLEIGDETVPLKPGTTVLIRPGTPHRGYGDFKTIVVCHPAFDPQDEYFPEEE